MTNLRYAVVIIGALSLLLGLSLGQNYFQQKRIEQLNFNRYQQSAIQQHKCLKVAPCDHKIHWNLKEMELKEKMKLIDSYLKYNRDLKRWEKNSSEYRLLFLREE